MSDTDRAPAVPSHREPVASPVFERLRSLLDRRILILDGAMGTMIQRHKLTEAQFRGTRFADHPKDLRGDSDVLILTQPEIISGIHHEYLAAGADIIETNTFNGTAVAQADYALEPLVYELNFEGARLARPAADASWPARLGRRTVPSRSHPTSTTRPSGRSRSTSCAPRTKSRSAA